MFFFFFGVLCGIFLQQEVPTIPKLKPYVTKVFSKISDKIEGVKSSNESNKDKETDSSDSASKID